MSTLKFKSKISVPGIEAEDKDHYEKLTITPGEIGLSGDGGGDTHTIIHPGYIEATINGDFAREATLSHSGLTLEDKDTGKITRVTPDGVRTNNITRQNTSEPIIIESQKDTPVHITYLQSTQATVGHSMQSITCILTVKAQKGFSKPGTGASIPFWQGGKDISVDNGHRLISYIADNSNAKLELDQSKKVLVCNYSEIDPDATPGDTKTVTINIQLCYGYKLPEELDKIHTQIDEMQLTIATEALINKSQSEENTDSLTITGEVQFTPYAIGDGQILEYGQPYVLNSTFSGELTYLNPYGSEVSETFTNIPAEVTLSKISNTKYTWSTTISLVPENVTGFDIQFIEITGTLTGTAKLPYVVESSLSDALSYIIFNMN